MDDHNPHSTYNCRCWLTSLTGTSSRSPHSRSPSVQPKVSKEHHLFKLYQLPLPSESPLFFVVTKRKFITSSGSQSSWHSSAQEMSLLSGILNSFYHKHHDHHPNQAVIAFTINYILGILADHPNIHILCMFNIHFTYSCRIFLRKPSYTFTSPAIWKGGQKTVQIFNHIGHSWSVLDIPVLTYQKVLEWKKKYSLIYIWMQSPNQPFCCKRTPGRRGKNISRFQVFWMKIRTEKPQQCKIQFDLFQLNWEKWKFWHLHTNTEHTHSCPSIPISWQPNRHFNVFVILTS